MTVRRLVRHEACALASLGRWLRSTPHGVRPGDLAAAYLVLALHAACVTRPHVVTPDGSLRLRHGVFFDLAVPPDTVASVRVERRYPDGRMVTLSEDGVLDLIVGNQTSVTLELNRPLSFTRPLGARARAHIVRFHADDPRAVVRALRQRA
ncbi:hypothetical protein ACFW42_25140 [Streptomyces albidoflavus]